MLLFASFKAILVNIYLPPEQQWIDRQLFQNVNRNIKLLPESKFIFNSWFKKMNIKFVKCQTRCGCINS